MDELQKTFPAESTMPEEDADFLVKYNTYLRFTRATEAKVEESKKRLKATIEWRNTVKPYQITEDQVANAIHALTMRVAGRCKAGRPILVMTLAVPNDNDVQTRVNLLLYILETTQRKGYEQITWIIDFGEMGKHKKDERSKESRKTTMAILQDHYPERLGSMLLYRTPWYINLLLPVVKPFMDKRTRSKVFNAGSTIKDLEKYADLDQLPDHLGGSFPSATLAGLDDLPDLFLAVEDHQGERAQDENGNSLEDEGRNAQPSVFDTADNASPMDEAQNEAVPEYDKEI